MKNLQKGFTLVELIVVITILAILGTIAFISLQGYSADARNSKRTSDLSSIQSSMTVKITGGASLLSFVTQVTNNLIGGADTGASVGGIATSAADYNAGTVNYSALGIKTSDFQDPDGDSYVLGITTKKGGQFELAASKEEGGGQRSAMVVGNYNPRTAAQIGTVSGTTLTLSASQISSYFVGDYVSTGGTSAKVTKISADGTTVTLDTDLGTGTGQLALAESSALIDSNGATANGEVTNGGSNLPY